LIEAIKKHYPDLLKKEYMDKFIYRSDFGGPLMFEFPPYGFADPRLFRYILTLGALGDLSGKSICEIGPGYGAQFKVITDVFPNVKYTFIDLVAPLFII
jgi:hypothetical protein